VLLTSCGSGNVSPGSNIEVNQGDITAKDNTAGTADRGVRISFDRSNSDDATYKQHIEALWEKTKVLLREDITKNYSDEELKKLGTEIDTAWVNLQIHSSINHMEEIDKIKDPRYANIIEDIMGIVDELYANRYTPPEEKRKAMLENLKNGRLEFKIKEFDETLQNAK
jgi:hypothetical protein